MILFLCTGNYYRSRFAEIVYNHLYGQSFSRGLKLGLHKGISKYAVQILSAYGIPVPEVNRDPISVTEDDLKIANRIIAMKESEHRPLLEKDFPCCLDKVEYLNIHDVDVMEPSKSLQILYEYIVNTAWQPPFG